MEEVFLIMPSGPPDSYCRLCLSDENIEPLLVPNGFSQSKQTLVQLIKQFMEIDLSSSLDSPCGICSTCRLLLEEFEHFREKCIRCDYFLTGTQRHGIPSEQNWPFQCSECFVKFRFKSEFEKHWKSFHDTPHSCDRCDARFSMQSLLKFHKFRYHTDATIESQKVSCTYCPRIFAGEKQLQFHVQVLHGPVETANEFVSPEKKRKRNKPVVVQQNGKSRRPFNCKICHLQYYFIGSLRRHMIDAHGLVRIPVELDLRRDTTTTDQVEIPQSFDAVITDDSATSLIICTPSNHATQKDSEIKPVLPDPASSEYMTFVPVYNSNQMAVDNVKPEMFVSSEVEIFPLVIAIKRLDPNLIPPILNYEISLEKIDYAQRELPELGFIDPHESEIAMDYSTYSTNTQQNSKIYVCDICQKEFNNSGSLCRHKQFVHEGIVYQCTKCGRQFSKRSNLERHAFQHSNEFPYGCDECPMAFIETRMLKRHKARYHVPGAPTQIIRFCPYCNRPFNKSHSLLGHMSVIHRDQYVHEASEEME